MADKKKCFIIMPIPTPKEMIPTYRNDNKHFNHVLDHLFVPAIEKAGFHPIKPIAEGADNIPAEIISNLDSSEIVLCDFSTFNPNVFFELGIRTALDKPVCLVKDELAPKIPFDVSIINCYTYKCSLDHWDMEKEIKDLSKHIKSSLARSNNINPLWKYFGIRTSAKSPAEGSEKDKLDLILSRLDDLQKDTPPPHISARGFYNIDILLEYLFKVLHDEYNLYPEGLKVDDNKHVVIADVGYYTSQQDKDYLKKIISKKLKTFGYDDYQIKIQKGSPI